MRAALHEGAYARGLLRAEDQAGAVGTRADCFCRSVSPAALQACSASSTVWSSQPSCSAMRGARCPRALANSIWHLTQDEGI